MNSTMRKHSESAAQPEKSRVATNTEATMPSRKEMLHQTNLREPREKATHHLVIQTVGAVEHDTLHRKSLGKIFHGLRLRSK